MLKSITFAAAILAVGWTTVCGPAAARAHLEAATGAQEGTLRLGQLIELRGAVEAGDAARIAALAAEAARLAGAPETAPTL